MGRTATALKGDDAGLDQHEKLGGKGHGAGQAEIWRRSPAPKSKGFLATGNEQPETEQGKPQFGVGTGGDYPLLPGRKAGKKRPGAVGRERRRSVPQGVARQVEVGRERGRQPGLGGFPGRS